MNKSKGLLLVCTDVNFLSELQGQWLSHTLLASPAAVAAVFPGPCDLCKCAHASHVHGVRSYRHLLSKALEVGLLKTT